MALTEKEREKLFRTYIRMELPGNRTLRIVKLPGDKESFYYRLFGDDSSEIGQFIFGSSSCVKSTDPIPDPRDLNRKVTINYIDLTPVRLSRVLKMFVLEQGYKVEIFDKDWKLFKTASPGNIEDIEDLLSPGNSNIEEDSQFGLINTPIIGSLKVTSNFNEGKRIGLSFYDSNSKSIGICEFSETDNFSNCGFILIQQGIKECIIPDYTEQQMIDFDIKKLIEKIKDDVTITKVKTSLFNNQFLEQTLITLTGNQHILSTSELSSLTLGQSCCNSLVEYLHLIGNNDDIGKFIVEKYDPDQFVKLDISAVRALNLFPEIGATGNNNTNNENKKTSLFGLLNHCKSAGGSRLLSQWIKQPIVDKDEIIKRQILVEWFLNNSMTMGLLQTEFLQYVPDIVKLIKRISNSKRLSGLDELVRLYQFTKKLNEGIKVLNEGIENEEQLENEDPFNPVFLIKTWWLNDLILKNEALDNYVKLIEETIDMDSLINATSASYSSNLIQVNPEYDPILSKLKEELNETMNEMEVEFDAVIEDLGAEKDKSIKFEYKEQHGWIMRVMPNSVKLIRGKPEYKQLQQIKAGVIITTMGMSKLNESYSKLTERYNIQQREIVSKIIEIGLTYKPAFIDLSTIISNLDVIISFSHAAALAPEVYTRPEKIYGLNELDRCIDIKEGRHPCLEQMENMIYIPNDYHFLTNEEEFGIITGPNMGGKSTYIRTIGVICLMNQIGSLIPCASGSKISIVDSILARVGASDSQLKGVSTFMAEMLEMSNILKVASSNSLVIVDELGRGTSTYDGFGLAWSISSFIANNIKCFTLFATHFHEITKLALENSNIFNLHVIAQVENGLSDMDRKTEDHIVLLYKVERGISDESFGINVAQLVKFPQKIINQAKRRSNELDDEKVKERANKMVKFSKEEISNGDKIIKGMLKKWKRTIEEKGGIEKLGSLKVKEELIEISKEYSKEMENSEVLKELFLKL